jgi:hypothetical protein
VNGFAHLELNSRCAPSAAQHLALQVKGSTWRARCTRPSSPVAAAYGERESCVPGFCPLVGLGADPRDGGRRPADWMQCMHATHPLHPFRAGFVHTMHTMHRIRRKERKGEERRGNRPGPWIDSPSAKRGRNLKGTFSERSAPHGNIAR